MTRMLTMTDSVRAMTRAGLEPQAIAERLGCSLKVVQQLLARLRKDGRVPPPPLVPPKQRAGVILRMLQDSPDLSISVSGIARTLGCRPSDIRFAIDRLVEVEAAKVVNGRVILIGSRPIDPASPSLKPIDRARLSESALLRRGFALARSGDRIGAVRLMMRAAEHAPAAVATNFLALSDLIGAGEGEFRDISAEAARAECERQGFASTEMVAFAAGEIRA